MTDLEALCKDLGPRVLGVLVRRGADFASAEDAVQEALLEAHLHWDAQPPDAPDLRAVPPSPRSRQAC